MAEPTTSRARWISFLIVLMHLAATTAASLCLWQLGDWEQHGWGLTLTLRILWGVWVVTAMAVLLTHVTIFGWTFRQYIRWAGDQMPAWARFRPSKAPWSKSGAASFSFTVAMVALTGAAVVTTAVMWILQDVTGTWVFWLVFKILWGSWWVLAIALVIARVSVFGWERTKALRELQKQEQQGELVHHTER